MFIFRITFIGLKTEVRNLADEHKAPRLPRRPTCLWSSADVSARWTYAGIVPGPALSFSRFSLSHRSKHAAAAKSPRAAAPATPCPGPHRPAPAGAALVTPRPTLAGTAPVTRAGPRPCPAAPDPPRPGRRFLAGCAPLLCLVTTKALCARWCRRSC
jgi:hypothetical protein